MPSTHEIITRNGDKVWLYTDDTWTLSIIDSPGIDSATENTETTPEILAESFTRESLESLKLKPHSEEAEKIAQALQLL